MKVNVEHYLYSFMIQETWFIPYAYDPSKIKREKRKMDSMII